MQDRVENEVFFATPFAHRDRPTVPEEAFYAGRPRPEPEVAMATRAAATHVRFALVLFLVGWAGILFQAGFLQQVVFGAPVFEELAKFGPPLLVVALLRARSLWIRLPLAWASGAAFGVMEHFVTYADESLAGYAERVLFHAASPGVSMLVYGAFESMQDVRARWIATIPATLVHWANNFLAVVIGFGTLFVRLPTDPASIAIGSILSAGMLAITLVGVLMRAQFERWCRRILVVAMPRLGLRNHIEPGPP